MKPAGEKLMNLLTQPSTYGEFSNKRFFRDPRNRGRIATAAETARGAMSIEAFHDTVHFWAGAAKIDPGLTGHMFKPPYSSFDPIFWFHHW